VTAEGYKVFILFIVTVLEEDLIMLQFFLMLIRLSLKPLLILFVSAILFGRILASIPVGLRFIWWIKSDGGALR